MIIRLVLSLAFIGAVLLFAARVAKKRGLGQGNGLIEVVARQRMGRASTVNVVRIADLVLVVGATEEQVTLLAEVDSEAVDAALRERRAAGAGSAAAETARRDAAGRWPPGRSRGALAGSVFDRNGWGTLRHRAARADGPPVMTAAARPLVRPGARRRDAGRPSSCCSRCCARWRRSCSPGRPRPRPTDPVAPDGADRPGRPAVDGNVDISIGDGSPEQLDHPDPRDHGAVGRAVGAAARHLVHQDHRRAGR